MGVSTPPPHIWTIEAVKFAQNLEERSQGAHSAAVFPAGQLGNDAQMLQLLQTGALDMVFMPIAEIANRLPEFGALYAPFLAVDIAGAAKLLNSPEARGMLEQLPEKVGAVGVGFALGGMRQMLFRDRIASAEDLEGLKIRVTPLEPIRDFYLQLGAAPIPMSVGSVYDALANGQIDAIDMDMELIWKQSYYALGDMVVFSNHMMFPMVGLISVKRWEKLASEDKELIVTLMREHMSAIVETYTLAEQQFEAQLRAEGIQTLTIGPEFFGPALDQWERKWLEAAPILEDLRSLTSNAR
jgi:TRAP-type C4-dicarboxylate transport system substrate-binding protein